MSPDWTLSGQQTRAVSLAIKMSCNKRLTGSSSVERGLTKVVTKDGSELLEFQEFRRIAEISNRNLIHPEPIKNVEPSDLADVVGTRDGPRPSRNPAPCTRSRPGRL
jgi:hypothetical protein